MSVTGSGCDLDTAHVRFFIGQRLSILCESCQACPQRAWRHAVPAAVECTAGALLKTCTQLWGLAGVLSRDNCGPRVVRTQGPWQGWWPVSGGCEESTGRFLGECLASHCKEGPPERGAVPAPLCPKRPTLRTPENVGLARSSSRVQGRREAQAGTALTAAVLK